MNKLNYLPFIEYYIYIKDACYGIRNPSGPRSFYIKEFNRHPLEIDLLDYEE